MEKDFVLPVQLQINVFSHRQCRLEMRSAAEVILEERNLPKRILENPRQGRVGRRSVLALRRFV